jgi:hypothetical protein
MVDNANLNNMNDGGNVSGGLEFQMETPSRGLILGDHQFPPDGYTGTTDVTSPGGEYQAQQASLPREDDGTSYTSGLNPVNFPEVVPTDNNQATADSMQGLITSVSDGTLANDQMWIQGPLPAIGYGSVPEQGDPLMVTPGEQQEGA